MSIEMLDDDQRQDRLDSFDPVLLRTFLECNIVNFTRYFFKKVYGSKFIVAPHHLLICRTLMRVMKGEIKRLVINIPPRYSKTELAIIMFMAYSFALNRMCKFLHVSYSDSLALKNSRLVRDIITSNWYRRLWSRQIRVDSRSVKQWNIVNGGGVYATAAKGQITGFGAGRMIEKRDVKFGADQMMNFHGALLIDDPIKPEDIHSDVIRDGRNEWINDTIASRLDHRDTPIILVMQRLHEDDTSGFLLNGGTGEMWHHLCVPVFIYGGNYDI